MKNDEFLTNDADFFNRFAHNLLFVFSINCILIFR